MHFTISPDHPSLPGHFPGQPIVPGVVLLDQVIQAIEASHGTLPPLRLPQVKFLRPLLPGQRAEIQLESTPLRWKFRVLREQTLLASGEIVAGPMTS